MMTSNRKESVSGWLSNKVEKPENQKEIVILKGNQDETL